MNQFYFLNLMLHGFWGNESVRLVRSTFVVSNLVY
jgi:hypothetical protein